MPSMNEQDWCFRRLHNEEEWEVMSERGAARQSMGEQNRDRYLGWRNVGDVL